MSDYVRRLKRQQIKERWKLGHGDPDYDVLPTKEDIKYIVHKRVEPLKQNDDNNHE